MGLELSWTEDQKEALPERTAPHWLGDRRRSGMSGGQDRNLPGRGTGWDCGEEAASAGLALSGGRVGGSQAPRGARCVTAQDRVAEINPVLGTNLSATAISLMAYWPGQWRKALQRKEETNTN